MILFLVVGTIYSHTRGTTPSMDEYVFVNLTQSLPRYESDVEWAHEWFHKYWDRDRWLGDDKETVRWKNVWHQAYDHPVWVHPPLANILAWPLVQTGDFHLMRLSSSVLILLSILLVMRKACTSPLRTVLAFLPLFAGATILFATLNTFYHDTFVLALLAVSLHLRESRYKKLLYLTLSLMVLTKLTAAVFLIPFVVSDRKLALCGLVLVPYLLHVWHVTGDPLYLWHHWTTMERWLDTWACTPTRIAAGLTAVLGFLVVSLPMVAYSIRQKRYFYPILYFIGLLMGVGWAGYFYHLYPMMLSSTRLVK